MRATLILLTVILTALLQLTEAAVIQVPGDQPTVQAGLDAVAQGDTVLVAAGVFQENLTWPSLNGITLIGAGIEQTILDGGGEESVILFPGDVELDSTTRVQRLTIANGSETGD